MDLVTLFSLFASVFFIAINADTGLLCPGITLDKTPLNDAVYKITCNTVKGCAGFQCQGDPKIPSLGHKFTFGLHVDACDDPITGHAYVNQKHVSLHSGEALMIPSGAAKLSGSNREGSYILFTAIRNGDNITATVSLTIDLGGLILPPKTFEVFNERANVKNLTCNKTIATPSSPPATANPATDTVPASSSSTVAKESTAAKSASSSPTIPKVPTTSNAKTPPTTLNVKTVKTTAKPSTTKEAPSPISTLNPPVTTKKKPTPSTAHSTPSNHTVSPKGKKHKGGLSRNMKIGIFVALVFVVLICAALVFYCRRLRKKRPSYYNDIAINDPMHADDEYNDDDNQPLFNAHLVL